MGAKYTAILFIVFFGIPLLVKLLLPVFQKKEKPKQLTFEEKRRAEIDTRKANEEWEAKRKQKRLAKEKEDLEKKLRGEVDDLPF